MSRYSAAPSPHVAPPPTNAGRWDLLVTVGLAVAAAMLAALVAGRAIPNHLYVSPVVLGAIGALLGFLLARSKIYDGFAHLVTVVIALGIGMAAVVLAQPVAEVSFIQQIRDFGNVVLDWVRQSGDVRDQREALQSFLTAVTTFMIGYQTTWMLFRLRSLFVAMLIPVLVTLGSIQFGKDVPEWPVIVLIGIVIALIIRFRFFRLQGRWHRIHANVGDGLAQRVAIVSLVLAVVVSGVVSGAPEEWSERVFRPIADRVIESVTNVNDNARSLVNQVTGRDPSVGPQDGAFSEFGDGFSVGGPLNLSDQPEVLVTTSGSEAPYLTARSYDHYSGRGWNSTSADSFQDGTGSSVRVSPDLLYRPGWAVALSNDATGQRQPYYYTVTALNPTNQTVFSVQTYASSNVPTVVRMSWVTVSDTVFLITRDSLTTLPPDIQALGALLLQADLSGDASVWGPTATSESVQAAIDQEVDDLARRGLEVGWTASSDGIVQEMHVTGRLPVFDDVESVSLYQPSAAVGQSTYQVTGLVSHATDDELTQAGTNYPLWLVDRYLETGDTVTQRTIDLTHDLVGDETDPLAQARIIETFLRGAITYDETVQAPPDGADLVDYVLFTSHRGYCEHYASAMAVMMRILGVPTRVVVGYYPGGAENGQFTYRQSNAHAWVETWFPGYGWIPFEPTANRPLGEFAAASGTEPATAVPGEEQAPPTPTVPPTPPIATPNVNEDNSQATPMADLGEDGVVPPAVLESPPENGGRGWVWPALGAAAVAIILIGLGSALWLWPLRGLSVVDGAHARLRRVGRRIGVPSAANQTPREYAAVIEKRAPALQTPVRRITTAYEVEHYAERGADAGVIDDVRAAWRSLRRSLPRVIASRYRPGRKRKP